MSSLASVVLLALALADPVGAQPPAEPYVVFLGTGAADIETPKLDNCPNCTYIREHGGRNWRRFSSLFVSPNVVIDFSTTGMQSLKDRGIEPASIDFLLITHSHADHLDPASIVELAKARAEKARGSLRLFANPTTAERVRKHLAASAGEAPIEVNEVRAHQEFEAGAWRCKALPANHMPDEECLLYVLRGGERSLLYATDTSWFPASTFGALRAEKLDLAMVEATFGHLEKPEYLTGHMNFDFARLVKRFLFEQGVMKPAGRFAVTHLSLHWCRPHDTLAPELEKEGILLPYDGLRIEL